MSQAAARHLLFFFPIGTLLFSLHLWFHNFGQVFFGGLVGTLLLALILAVVTGSGRLLLRAFGIQGLLESEKTLIGATLGLGLLSQILMGLGLMGGFRTWVISILLGALWIIGFTEIRGMIRSLKSGFPLLRDQPFFCIGVLVCLGLIFAMTWVPPHQYDALVYHLPIPAAYVREGRIHTVPHLVFTHFPQNGEMLYTLALLLGSDLLAQMFTWLGVFLSVWWLFEMGKREVPVSTVLLACLLTLTHTAVMLLGSIAYVECLVMLWITAAVFSFFRWREQGTEWPYARGWLSLSGIFSGLALGTKYYAGICPAILGVYLLGRWVYATVQRLSSASNLAQAKDLLTYVAWAMLFGAPWLIKNIVIVGNPVFPFFYQFMPLRGIPWAAQSAERYFQVLTEYGHKGHFLKDLLQFPYLAAMSSERFGGGADILGDLGWGIFLLAVPAGIWASWKNRYLRWILAYCVVHWLTWFSTGVVLRFLIVIVPLASLVAAQGLRQVWQRLGAINRGVLASGLVLLIAGNLGLFFFVHSVFDSLSVLVGLRSRNVYLSRLDYYPCARFATDNVPTQTRILVVGEQRGYYITQPHTTTTPMAPNSFVSTANAASSAADLARRLKKQGYRYLLLAPREAERLGGYGVFHFSESGYAYWMKLQESYTRLIYEAPGRCGLYELA